MLGEVEDRSAAVLGAVQAGLYTIVRALNPFARLLAVYKDISCRNVR